MRFNRSGILVGVNNYRNYRKCVTFLLMSVNCILFVYRILGEYISKFCWLLSKRYFVQKKKRKKYLEEKLVTVKIKSIGWLSCERRMYVITSGVHLLYLWFTNLLSLREESISRDSMKYELHKKRNCVASMIYAMDSSQ